MTSIWGPLGWMTLHSTAFAYSDTPTQSERDLMYTWLDMFRDTITCPSCKGHFENMLASYRSQFPTMLASRQDFVVFTFRAHNSVNKRIQKPVYSSVSECIAALQGMLAGRRTRDFRNSYFQHISRHWRMMQDVTGIVALRKIQEMRRIEAEYVLSRDTDFTNAIRPEVVVIAQSIMERPTEATPDRPYFLARGEIPSGFRLTSTGFRLRR
jgi:hypothetical protein